MFETYRFDVLVRHGAYLGVLAGVEDASISGNANRQVKWDGQISLARPELLDHARMMIRPVYIGPAGELPLGVYVAEQDTLTVREGAHVDHSAARFNLYDRTRLLALDKVEATYTVVAGTSITQAVRALIASTGEVGVSITDRPETLRTDLVWDPGTSKLTIINELLDAGGFFALHTNRAGQYVLRPYEAPSTRPVVKTYAPAGRDLYHPEVSTVFPEAPANKIILRARGDGEATDLVAVALNEADFQATGSWRALFADVEATSQAVLDTMARRRLTGAQQAAWKPQSLHCRDRRSHREIR